jgi:hypothetical protein
MVGLRPFRLDQVGNGAGCAAARRVHLLEPERRPPAARVDEILVELPRRDPLGYARPGDAGIIMMSTAEG